VTNASQDDASDVPVVFSSFVMNECTAHSGLQSGFFGDTFGIAAFFGCAFIFRARHHFSDVGMFPWQ
jgi:hypothetical protein